MKTIKTTIHHIIVTLTLIILLLISVIGGLVFGCCYGFVCWNRSINKAIGRKDDI